MTMTRFWNELEGVYLTGRYRLEQCLNATATDAWYLTRLENGLPAALRLMPDHSLQAAQQLSAWQVALGFDHPNLVRILDAGRANADGTPLIFAVCEYPDDFLAALVEQRPLSAAETRELLGAALGALRYLHERGFVHSAIDPAHFMAFGDRVKLSCDSLQSPGARPPFECGPYDPPEAAGGLLSAAGDLWALAITVHEALTQNRPNLTTDSEFLYLAEPFATILRNCLKPEPEERWTIADIENHLRPAVLEPAPVPPPVPPPLPARAPRAVAGRGFPIRWVPVLGVFAALGLGAVLLRKPDAPPPAPPPDPAPSAAIAPKPVVPSAARVAAPLADVSLPRPSALSNKPERHEKSVGPAVWRVVAWTYSTRQAAEKKVHTLNRKSPQWKAEVFAPNGSRGPYFVSVGGRMTRADALQLQARARAKGLPNDTFARNFSK
jgi:hypothetical protein